MLRSPFHAGLVLTGPTASGKTQLGLELAEKLGAEIVSLDSMALYRGMDVGTAKPTAEERRQVRHHLIDVLEPWQSASVAWWLEQAEQAVRDIEGRGKRVLFVGGTPLYLKTLLCGLFDGPPADAALRRRLEEEAGREGGIVLHRRLAEADPPSAARLHPNDVRRLVRALEVLELTGRPLSDWQRQWPRGGGGVDDGAGAASAPRVLWLDLPRPTLYERIDRRVKAMFAAGLVGEVRRLEAASRGLGREAGQAIGYKETVEHLQGRCTLAEAIERVQRRTRNFAKRQITWFRHLPGCAPVTAELTWKLWASTM